MSWIKSQYISISPENLWPSIAQIVWTWTEMKGREVYCLEEISWPEGRPNKWLFVLPATISPKGSNSNGNTDPDFWKYEMLLLTHCGKRNIKYLILIKSAKNDLYKKKERVTEQVQGLPYL